MHCRWVVGIGKQINLWLDRWVSDPIVSLLNVSGLQNSLKGTVSNVISNQEWHLPSVFKDEFPLIAEAINKNPLPIQSNDDCLIWEPSKDGTLNLTDSFAMFQAPSLPVNGMKFIWKSFIPPKLSTLAWRLLHLMLPTDDALQRRGIFLVSACLLCDTLQCQESIMHVFLQCHFAQRCWRWLMNLFHTTLDFHLGIIFGIPFSTKGCLRKFQISGLWLVWWFFFSSGKLVTSCGLKTFSHPSLGFALILKQYWGESV